MNFRTLVLICASAAIPLALLALGPVSATPTPTIPNPVSIFYGYQGLDKTYLVGCWSGPGERGTWLGVRDSTYTQQEALVYTPPPPSPDSDPRLVPSILYCFGSDGKPGIIQGAPPGMMLVPGTRVVTYTTAQITTSRRQNGKVFQVNISIPLLDTTALAAGPDGVIIRSSQHDMTVYPAGSTVTIGSGKSVGFFRPGTLTETSISTNPGGCTVSIIDVKGATTTRHYAQDCSEVETSKSWTKE